MQEKEFEPYQKAIYFMKMKDFLLQKWFGEHVLDYSMATSTGLMNLKTLDWDEETLEIAGINREQLAKIVPPTEVLPPFKEDIAHEIGRSEERRVGKE